jgi:N-methylhydantoinase A/oxoprolinase/acetone carboxylase beta subunit
MLLGIDVGGTHTDAVVVDRGGILAEAKVPTDHDNMLGSFREALAAVLEKVDPAGISRLNLSTTLSTNAIVESKTEEVGLLVTAGPGIDPENMRAGKHFHVLGGALDHRGVEIEALDDPGLERAVSACTRDGVKVFAAVGKFSVRNPAHENAMAQAASPHADFLTKGHNLSGLLNFPRRLATAYFNSAVWRLYNDFAWAVQESAAEFGLSCEINVLKADGGTMPLAVSRDFPVETILSGPAASVMGVAALESFDKDCLILDIGGTTTDIAVVAGGSPVVEKEGMVLGSYPTLVKALRIRSIGVGGDSVLRVSRQGVQVGPERQGPALANCETAAGRGGECGPALTDALNVLGHSAFGNVEASRSGIDLLAEGSGLSGEEVSRLAVEGAVENIRRAVEDLLFEINEKPVYTISELLEGEKVAPDRVYVMGGPAEALAGRLENALGLETLVPRHFAVANAVGAAMTRVTVDLELIADTGKGELLVPALDLRREVPRNYDLEKAEAEALEILRERLEQIGAEEGLEPEIVDSSSFNMVEGFRTTGRNIRVRCQIRPSVRLLSPKSNE